MEILYQQLINKSSIGINLLTVELPCFEVPWHYHREVEIIYIDKSHGMRFVGDHSETFKEGDVALIGSNLPHVWRNVATFKDTNCELVARALVIHFNYDLFDGKIVQLPEMDGIAKLLSEAKRGVRFYGNTAKELATIIKCYINSVGIAKLSGLLHILHLMASSTEKMFLASHGYSKIRTSSDFNRFDKIHHYLIENFHKSISLKHVAAMIGMTPTSFCRYFKKRTTKPFLTFLNELRIGHACKLLQENKLSISGIAIECGFNNLSNFNYLFKKTKGVTPSQYKDSHFI